MKSKGAFRVLCDGYVTADSGTGVVHQAPYFGEDDYRVCLAAGVIRRGQDMICPVDASGRFLQPVADFVGQYVKVGTAHRSFRSPFHLLLVFSLFIIVRFGLLRLG